MVVGLSIADMHAMTDSELHYSDFVVFDLLLGCAKVELHDLASEDKSHSAPATLTHHTKVVGLVLPYFYISLQLCFSGTGAYHTY